MNKHITTKKMASYIAGTLRPRVRKRVENHIRECGPCRSRHEKLLALIAPRYRSLQAGDHVWERIMGSWREMAARGAYADKGGVRTVITRRPLLTAAAFTAAAILVVVIAGLMLRGPGTRPGMMMVAEGTVQGVSINGKPARQGDQVGEGEPVILADGSSARIVYDDLVRIDIAGKGELAVHEFRSDTASGVNFGITLTAGTLVSSVHARGRAVTYEYLTTNAHIEPLGTEFLLQAYGGTTLVILKEGGIRVTNRITGKGIDVTAGFKCIIGDSFMSMRATAEDLSIFNDLEGLRAGKYSRLLLPWFPGPNAPAVGGEGTSGAVKDAGVRDDAAVGREEMAERNERAQSSREIMRQRAEENRTQMNEMRRNSRMNMNQQMRRGR